MNTRKDDVRIIDSTLRDGEQAPGVAFTCEEKFELVRLLDDAGVDELEVGTPAMGSESCREIQAMVRLRPRCTLTSWCRAIEADIDLAEACGTNGVHISFPVSPILLHAMEKSETWVMETLVALVASALDRFRLVSVGAQDAFRADPGFLDRFVRSASSCGAHRLRLADTVGMARPSRVADLIQQLASSAGATALEFHGHNDLGMATANTVSAIEAGISAVSVTVNGIGERAGNAPLEQVAVVTSTLENRHSAIDTRKLVAICRFVSRITRRPIAVDCPITGEAAFSHESGIHCAAVLKDPDTYQPFSPEILGREGAQLLVGLHSGSAVLRHTMNKAGLTLDDQKTEQLLTCVRAEALRKKSFVSPCELVQLYQQLCS